MNNLVYFRGILVWPMIVIVFWTVEINLVYFAQKRRLICDCDSFSGLLRLTKFILRKSAG